jgi:hypothetical protein
MHNRLGQLRELLHAQRKRIYISITRLAQANEEKCFVRALEGGAGRQARKFSHEANEVNARHL